MSEDLPVPGGEFLLYATEDGRARLSVRVHEGTVWLSQAAMAELFQTTKQNVSLHLQNIYEEEELHPEATVKQYLTVQTEGERQVRLECRNYSYVLCHGPESSRSRRCSSPGPHGPLSVPPDTDWPRRHSSRLPDRRDRAQGSRHLEDGLDDLFHSPSAEMMTAAEVGHRRGQAWPDDVVGGSAGESGHD